MTTTTNRAKLAAGTSRWVGFRLLLAVVPTLLAMATAADARAVAPPSSTPEPAARRTAARALERSFSTQWLPDVGPRLRLLSEIVDRESAASGSAAQRNAPLTAPGPREELQR
jgi:hypothetical protein